MKGNWFRLQAIGIGVLIAGMVIACGGESTTGGTSTAPSAPAASSAAPASTAPATATTGSSFGQTSVTPAASAPASNATPATPSAAQRFVIVPDKSTATYHVGETFFFQNNAFNLAEGSTGDVTGEMMIDRNNPSASKIGTIKVNISKLQSDSDRRDENIRQEWLESAKFPIATFVPKRLEGLPTTPYTDGQELTFKIIGDLTIRTVTKEVTFDTKAKIVGDTLTGTATTKFNMTDFGFNPPDIAGFLKAQNGVELIIKIEAKRQP